MAIPEKPLKLSFDPDALTLDEMALFEPDVGIRASVFKGFLAKYGNWSKRELAGLVRADIVAVWVECVRQVTEAISPKAKAGS